MAKIQAYLSYLRHERNFSRHTEISYSTDLRQFEGFIRQLTADFQIEEIDSDLIRRWIMWLADGRDGNAKLSSRTIARKLTAVKSFFAYWVEIGALPKNPARGIKTPRQQKPLPAFVRHHQAEKLLIETESTDYESVRDDLIFELFYVTGMRREELIRLRDIDVDFSAEQLLVNGKRNKQRLLPLSRPILEKIRAYLLLRNREVERKSSALFLLKTGYELYPMLVYRLVKSRLQTIDTLPKASPHVLRHSFATEMLNRGAEINSVKQLLGHSSLASTEVYTHTSVEELKEIYKTAHPRAEKDDSENT